MKLFHQSVTGVYRKIILQDSCEILVLGWFSLTKNSDSLNRSG